MMLYNLGFIPYETFLYQFIYDKCAYARIFPKLYSRLQHRPHFNLTDYIKYSCTLKIQLSFIDTIPKVRNTIVKQSWNLSSRMPLDVDYIWFTSVMVSLSVNITLNLMTTVTVSIQSHLLKLRI